MRPESRRQRAHKGGGHVHRGHSLFFKLLLVLLAAAVLVNVCVGGFFRMAFSHRAHEAMRQNLSRYAGYLARDIGSPPDTARARALAREHSLAVRYEGPGGAWATDPGLEDLAEGRRHFPVGPLDGGEDGDRMGWNHGRYYVQIERDGARYLFATDFRQAVGAKWPFVAALIGLLSLILGGTWLVIRRLLRPLRELTAAVEGLGNGELGRQVPAGRRRDELGELARSFNGMSTRMQEMVRGREQLLLDVSHELRSPLTRIKVALEMAPEGSAKESIRDDLGEMDAMIGEILEAARLDSAPGRLVPEPVDLAALCAEAAGGFAGAGPGVEVAPPPEGGLPARVDKERVRKVLSNVIGNAVKYSRASGRPVEVGFEGRPGESVVIVEDRGIGIPAADLPRLFEPFYRVDRSRSRDTGGYGLGLSLCKRIMEAHGGSIEIRSREGEGTRVFLRFPRE
jgi:signal transduction histidine kinase